MNETYANAIAMLKSSSVPKPSAMLEEVGVVVVGSD